jgi:hypothetical protein
MEFNKNEVREVLINGNASSLYHVREKDKITGQNSASGDTIFVSFRDNQVSSVVVYGSSKGTYFVKE